jgi:hypothetical protein
MALRDLVFYDDKGIPSKPTGDEQWAIFKIREFNYRQLFNLSKEDMVKEPIEDFIVNEEIMRLFQTKAERESKKLNKHGRH